MDKVQAVSLKGPTSRRNLLLGGVAAAAAVSMGQLSGCSATTTVIPAVVDVINKIIAGTCQIVPVLVTVVDVIVSVFPAAAGVATITEALAKQIADYICTLFKSAGFQHGKHPGKTLSAKVGTTNIELHGYMVIDGQLVYI